MFGSASPSFLVFSIIFFFITSASAFDGWWPIVVPEEPQAMAESLPLMAVMTVIVIMVTAACTYYKYNFTTMADAPDEDATANDIDSNRGDWTDAELRYLQTLIDISGAGSWPDKAAAMSRKFGTQFRKYDASRLRSRHYRDLRLHDAGLLHDADSPPPYLNPLNGPDLSEAPRAPPVTTTVREIGTRVCTPHATPSNLTPNDPVVCMHSVLAERVRGHGARVVERRHLRRGDRQVLAAGGERPRRTRPA